jgi:GntR family transcriptional regulator
MNGRGARKGALDAFAESTPNPLLAESSIPLYDQLGRVLRRFIEEEQLQPGDRFPPEEAIATQFGVSRPTVNRAVQELINQGWLERERGRGTFVRNQQIVDLALLSENLSLTEQFPRDAVLRTEFISRRVLKSNRHVAHALGLPPDAPILYLRRLRFVNECPVMVCDAYLSAERFSDLDRKTFVGESLYATLEEKFRFLIDRSERRVEANEVVDPAVAELLRVPLFSPILLLTGQTFVEGEESPIELMTAYVRERVAFKSTVRRRTTHGSAGGSSEGGSP